MQRTTWWTAAASILLAVASLAWAQPAPAPQAEYPWPGYVAGGRFFRDLEWGVSFYGPDMAQIDLTPARSTLVRYSLPAEGQEPGWTVTVVVSKVSAELSAADQLAASARELTSKLGDRVSNLKAQPEAAGGLISGRLSCQVAPAPGQTGESEYRNYIYCRLREKQYLTLVGSAALKASGQVDSVLNVLAGSLRVFDPQAEAKTIQDAAARMTKLLADTKAEQFDKLARQTPEQWFRAFELVPPAKPQDKPTPAQAGWGRLVMLAHPQVGQIEAIASFRLARQGQSLASYQSAYVDLAGGDELLRDYSRTEGTGVPKTETFFVARKQGRGPNAKFDVVERITGQPQDRRYEIKLGGEPYVPMAIQGLLFQMAPGSAGQMLGAFSLTPARSSVAFGTLANRGPGQVSVGGTTLPGVRWFSRQATSLPVTVRWTDPAGVRVLRMELSPVEWLDAAADADVPADVRRDLAEQPNWPQ